jgi:hypothetical protein
VPEPTREFPDHRPLAGLRRPPTPVLHAALWLRRSLRALRARIGPPNADIMERTFAIAEARAVGIAAELDLAELVADIPRTTAELAATTGANEDALDRMLRLLSATGCFRLGRDGRWRNTRSSAALRASHRYAARDWARFFGGGAHLRIWAAADESIRTGASATRASTGQEFFEWLTTLDRDAGARFDGAMLEGSRFLASAFVPVIRFPAGSTVCDVGGGTGRLLAEVVRRNPGVHGILYDLPPVVAAAGPVLDRVGVADRVEVVGGSFFERVPAGADRQVLLSVIHDWDDERAAQILRCCVDALAPGGRTLVVEQVLDPRRAPLFERHTDLLMLVLTGAGRERTDDDFRRLFDRARVRVTGTTTLATLHTVYELAPA